MSLDTVIADNDRLYTTALDAGLEPEVAYDLAHNFGLEDLASDIEEFGGVTDEDIEADILGL